MENNKYTLNEEPNCIFYLNNKEDDSKIGVLGKEKKYVFCVVKNCIGYDSEGKILQKDENLNTMKGCGLGACIENRIPIDKNGKEIDLGKIKGVNGLLKKGPDVRIIEWSNSSNFAL